MHRRYRYYGCGGDFVDVANVRYREKRTFLLATQNDGKWRYPVVPTSCRECPVLGGADIPARREEGAVLTQGGQVVKFSGMKPCTIFGRINRTVIWARLSSSGC